MTQKKIKKSGQKNQNVQKEKKIEDKKVAEKNDSINTSKLNVFNMFKTMPQAKFNLQSKINIESGKANEKTHLEVSKNLK